MSTIPWRKFTFFEKELCDENVDAVFKGTRISCALSEGGSLMFGDVQGYVYISDRNSRLSNYKKHRLYRGELKGLAYIYHPLHRQRQYIIAVGDDGERSGGGSGSGTKARAIEYLSIKIFSTDDWSHPLHSFPVLPVSALQALPSSADVSAFAVLPDGSQISVGFSTGMVVLFAGAFLSDDALGKQITGQLLQSAQVYTSPNEHIQPRYIPVSGLHFCELVSLRRVERRVRLYVVMDTERITGADANPIEGNVILLLSTITFSLSLLLIVI